MAEKKSFVLYHDSREQIEMLTDEQAGKLLKALMEFAVSGEEPALSDPMVRLMFSVLSAQIRRDNEKYIETCERNAQNGRKGGRPKKTDRFSEKPTAKGGFFKKPKKADSDNDSDSVSENEKDTIQDSDSDSDSDTPPAHSTPHTAQSKQMDVPEVLRLAESLGFSWTAEDAREFLAYNIDKGRQSGWGFAVRKWEENRTKRAPAPPKTPSGISKYQTLVNRFLDDFGGQSSPDASSSSVSSASSSASSSSL